LHNLPVFLFCFLFAVVNTHLETIRQCQEAIAEVFVGWSHDHFHTALFLSGEQCILLGQYFTWTAIVAIIMLQMTPFSLTGQFQSLSVPNL
jgi:hypothetical protein